LLTGALETLRVIKIVSKDKAGLNTGEAAGLRHLLPESESAKEDDGEIVKTDSTERKAFPTR
jgi:hypothetical protein